MSDGLDSLFRPSAIAVIGASASPGKIGNAVTMNLMAGNRKVYPVNPNEAEIAGLRCYGSVEEIPGPVDLAVVTLPAGACVEAVRGCVSKGVGAVIVSASGFGESGEAGRKREEELVEAVKGTPTRILGPNTMGLFVPSASLDTLFIPPERSGRPDPGSVAMISQSGAVAVSFLEKAEASGMGVSACVCVGNRCDIDEIELVQHFANDHDTKSIALYLESFSDGRRFVEASREVTRVKPMAILKSGRTPAGSRAARSHTGAIAASSDQIVDGALRQAAVVRVSDEEALVDISRALSVIGHTQGGRVCVIASAGGFGVIASDIVDSCDSPSLQMAELSKETTSSLKKVVPSFVSPQNPVDLTAGVTDEMYDEALKLLQSDQGVDSIMMSLELQPPNITSGLVEIAAKRSCSDSTPIVVSAFARDQIPLLKEMGRIGLVAYPTIRRSLRALDALAERGAHLRDDR
ncbi:MAG: acetate--CoA ligase family protein [Thermoplasmata archaeon]|nr:acetate--CoA ligase family protein [Thermoplasmata archaeon]